MALCTKTNQRPRLKQVRIEVRFVTAVSRGFFFSLGRISGFAAHNHSFATKRKPSGNQGIREAEIQREILVFNFQPVMSEQKCIHELHSLTELQSFCSMVRQWVRSLHSGSDFDLVVDERMRNNLYVHWTLSSLK